MPSALIVNASPLIFLGNAGRIDLLRAVGSDRILVNPKRVLLELRAAGMWLSDSVINRALTIAGIES